MYMYAEGKVVFGDGSVSKFGEQDAYGSMDDVKQYALSLIQEDENRTFSIEGMFVTDYSNLNFKINYNGSVCTLSKTDYYWWLGYMSIWDDEDPLESCCYEFDIEPGTPAYESLKKAYEERGRYIFSAAIISSLQPIGSVKSNSSRSSL